MMRRQARRLPRGTTLVETAALVTLSAVLTGVVVASIGSLFGINQAINHSCDKQIALQQFGAMLRQDIHQATNCQLDAAEQILQLQLPQSFDIEYRIVSHRWVRMSTSGDAEPVTTAFGLDGSFSCQGDIKLVKQGALLSVSFVNSTPKSNANARDQRLTGCEISAIVGRGLLEKIELSD